MHDDDVRAVLRSAVPDLAPSRVDPALAIRAGRRRRNVAVAAAALAVPVVLAAGTFAVARGGPAPEPAPPAAPAATTPATPDPATPDPATPDPAAVPGLPGTAPSAFDPLVATLTVGWRPPGFDARARSTGRHRQELSFLPRRTPVADGQAAPPDQGLYVSVLAAGGSFGEAERSYGVDAPEKPERTPAAPVRGRPAHCLGGSCAALRWEYAPGTWAWVSYAGPGDAGAVARRVAESVSLRAREPVRLPFRLTGRTAELAVTGITVATYPPGWTGSHGERWSASIDLDRPGSPRPDPDDHRPRGITVGVLDRPASAGPLPDGRDPLPNTEIGGRPANVDAAGTELVRWGVRDTRLSVSVHSGPWKARAIDADLVLVDDPADTSTWVDPTS